MRIYFYHLNKRKSFPLSAARIRVANGSVGRRFVTSVTRSIYANYLRRTSVASWKYDGYSCRNKASAKRKPHNYGCGYSIGWHIVLPRHEYSFSLNYISFETLRRTCARLRQTAEENSVSNILNLISKLYSVTQLPQFAKLPRPLYSSILNNLRFFVQHCITQFIIYFQIRKR